MFDRNILLIYLAERRSEETDDRLKTRRAQQAIYLSELNTLLEKTLRSDQCGLRALERGVKNPKDAKRVRREPEFCSQSGLRSDFLFLFSFYFCEMC